MGRLQYLFTLSFYQTYKFAGCHFCTGAKQPWPDQSIDPGISTPALPTDFMAAAPEAVMHESPFPAPSTSKVWVSLTFLAWLPGLARSLVMSHVPQCNIRKPSQLG